ncbi:MAG: hypothetical protein R3A48_17560 [Polyangiales bacterium]
MRQLTASHRHCGACNTCAINQQCVAGACVPFNACLEPQTSCGGVCVDLRSSRTNCGACGNACATGQSCLNGRCEASCPSLLGYSTYATGVCAPTQGDSTYCPSFQCPNGQVCDITRSCRPTCSPGSTQCGRECVNLTVSHRHCGACNNTCTINQQCVSGRCT